MSIVHTRTTDKIIVILLIAECLMGQCERGDHQEGGDMGDCREIFTLDIGMDIIDDCHAPVEDIETI